MGKIIDAFLGPEVQQVAAIPLDRAVLCLNCETVFDIDHQHTCPKCAGEIWLNIGLALGNEATKSRVIQMNDHRRVACR
jgi:rRNA maturation endonuclease Nob1